MNINKVFQSTLEHYSCNITPARLLIPANVNYANIKPDELNENIINSCIAVSIVVLVIAHIVSINAWFAVCSWSKTVVC